LTLYSNTKCCWTSAAGFPLDLFLDEKTLADCFIMCAKALLGGASLFFFAFLLSLVPVYGFGTASVVHALDGNDCGRMAGRLSFTSCWTFSCCCCSGDTIGLAPASAGPVFVVSCVHTSFSSVFVVDLHDGVGNDNVGGDSSLLEGVVVILVSIAAAVGVSAIFWAGVISMVVESMAPFNASFSNDFEMIGVEAKLEEEDSCRGGGGSCVLLLDDS